MIKLQDFAKQQGVTDRAIQKHLKKYEAELEGLFERKGPNGTWLTDEACEILRGKMKQQPVVVSEPDPRVERLEERVRELEEQVSEKDKLLSLAHQQVQSAQAQVTQLQEASAKVALLEADNKAVRQRAEQAEEERRLAEERARVSEQERIAMEEALEQMRKEDKMRADEAQAAEEQHAQTEQALAQELEQKDRQIEEKDREIEEFRNAGFFKRLFGWKK